MKYIAPKIGETSFHCPMCGVLSAQTWSRKIACAYSYKTPNGMQSQGASHFHLANTAISKCGHCEESSIWINQNMVYPKTGNIELPNDDLPEDIKKDYNEAKDIVNISPRGSSALLRLAIQKLCIHLGEKGKNINNDIASLVKKGLPQSMQQALDSVRVVGNNAVHPGELDLNDNLEIAYALFGFVNIICEVLISQPKKIQEFYDKNLPSGAKEGIVRRDR